MFVRFSGLFYLLWLSMSLTGAAAFGQATEVDRRAYVHAAYEEFHGLLYFLSGSEPFLRQLSQEERAQFNQLGQAIVQHVVRLGPGNRPGADRTSLRVKPRLYFSTRREDFILPPDKIERTAKMDGDIWFNLNIINNPTHAFGLLDAFQILFHEFSHQLGEQKDQVLIDQVAAKIKTYLSGFYKEADVTSGIKSRTLLLPYLLIHGRPVDYQPEPIVILDVEGRAVELALDVPSLRSPDQGYGEGSTTQAYTRMSLTPQFQVYQGKILFEWSVETAHYLIAAQRFNYIDLYTNFEKVRPVQVLDPILAYKKSFQMIQPQELVLPKPGSELKHLPLKNHAESPQHYRPVFEQKWKERLSVRETKGGRIWLEAIIESPQEVKEVFLLGRVQTDVLQFAGRAEKLADGSYRLRFSVPESSARRGGLYFDGIAFNANVRWELEERLQVQPKLDGQAASPTLASVEVWNGQKWQNADEISTPVVNTDNVKMRLYFRNAKVLLNHLEATWLVSEDIKHAGQKVGFRYRTVQEVLGGEHIRQYRESDRLVVEFSSPKMTDYFSDEAGQNGFVALDSGFRAMIAMQFVDQHLNVFGVGTRVTPNGWKSAFTLIKPRQSSKFDCETALGASQRKI